MYNIDFNKHIHVYFMGIGGISMSAIAMILLDKGFTVSGSDSKESEFTDKLTQHGAQIFYGQKAENITQITPKVDLFVYTGSIKEDNPEYIATINSKAPMLTRAQLLGQMMKNYTTAIGVSGTDGKTTTTSLIAQMLIDANTDPTILTGGVLKSINGNLRIGQSPTMITEACEYTNSFLSFFPTLAIILNVREDHLDFFKDINDIRNSFREFASLVPANGTLVINSEIDDLAYFTRDLACHVVTFGLDPSSSMYSAINITFDEFMHPSYDLVFNGQVIDHINLKISGVHNISNSLAAIAAAKSMDIGADAIHKAISTYTGTDRRFQFKGKLKNVTVIDDYAHNPDEINATLSTAIKCSHDKLWVVFQPHTYTRTKALFKEFAKALSQADYVVLADIYSAREENIYNISSKDLVPEIEKYGTKAYYLPSFEEIEKFLLENCINNDLLITMGAGDVDTIANDLLGL